MSRSGISSACTSEPIPASRTSPPIRSGTDHAINRYLDTLRARNFAGSTIRGKETFLRYFRVWLVEEGSASSLTSIGEETAKAYRLFLSSHLSATTWNPRLAAVRSFFAWAARNDLVLLNPFENVRPSPMQTTLPPYLTQAEVKMLLEACDPETQLRDRALLELMYSSGLRIRELVNLDLTDIDYAERVVLIRQGKGRKDRVVPVGRIAAKLTQRYVQTVRVASSADARALFVDRIGHRVTTDGVRSYILAPAVRGAGIIKHVTPHVLRHSCAVHMLENGASVREVQQLLGHAKISTTQKYLNVIPIELKKAHRAAHPAEHQQMPGEASPRQWWRALRHRVTE